MAKSFKDCILTVLGLVAAAGVYMGLQGFLGPGLSGFLAVVTFILVTFMDYIIYSVKRGRENVARNNIICIQCHNVIKSKQPECPICGSSQ